MAQWLQGGLRRMNDVAAAWQNANLFASVVDGPSATINNDPITLEDFLNDGNSLMSDAKNLSLSGNYVRLIGWSGNARTLRLRVDVGTGVTFTAPAAAQNCNGILIHEENDTNPAASYVWAFEPRVGDPTTQGGDIVWGNAGENIPLTYSPISGGTGETGRSSIEAVRAVADYWGTTDARLGYSLVRDTGVTVFQPSWETLQDALTAGVVFCTGTDPSKDVFPTSNSPKHDLTQRVSPGPFSDPWLTYPVQSTTEVTFDSTHANWTPTEIATSVLTYLFLNTPAWDANNVRIWAWDNIANYTLQAGRNLIYGGTSGSGNKNTLQVAIT